MCVRSIQSWPVHKRVCNALHPFHMNRSIYVSFRPESRAEFSGTIYEIILACREKIIPEIGIHVWGQSVACILWFSHLKNILNKA